jgi:hypothetical protein
VVRLQEDDRRGGGAMDPRVERIIDFLNDQHIRATYKAVGDAIEVPARSVATLLGGRTPRASWVVNAKNGEPTDYTPNEKHPALYEKNDIIQTGDDLIRRMKRWTAT